MLSLPEFFLGSFIDSDIFPSVQNVPFWGGEGGGAFQIMIDARNVSVNFQVHKNVDILIILLTEF